MTETERQTAMKAIGEVFRQGQTMRDAIEAPPDPIRGRMDLATSERHLDEQTHGMSNAYAELDAEAPTAQQATTQTFRARTEDTATHIDDVGTS